MDDDFAEAGAKRLEFSPEPGGHDFDGGVFEAGDVVEVSVVEQVEERSHGAAYLGVVVDPADCGIDLTFDRDLDFEAVAVHPLALVVAREVGQGLGGFEAEFFDEAGAHGVRIGEHVRAGRARLQVVRLVGVRGRRGSCFLPRDPYGRRMRSIRDFGVLPGRAPEGNARDLQDAIDWASARGGELYVDPSAEPYPVAGGVVLRENVSLLGANGPVGRGTTHPRKSQPNGSVFALEDESRPFLSVESASRIGGIQFWYPNQSLDDASTVIEYPPTIQVSGGAAACGVTFSNLTFYGEFTAFDFAANASHPCELVLWEHCYGYPLSGQFIRLAHCRDVARILHCHVSPWNQRLIRGGFSPEVVDSVVGRGNFSYSIDEAENVQLTGVFGFGSYGGARFGPASSGQISQFGFRGVTVGIEKRGEVARNRTWMVTQGAIVANAGYDVALIHPVVVEGGGHLGLSNVEAYSEENTAVGTASEASADFLRIRGNEALSVALSGCRMSGYESDDPIVIENPQASVRALGCIDRDGAVYER